MIDVHLKFFTQFKLYITLIIRMINKQKSHVCQHRLLDTPRCYANSFVAQKKWCEITEHVSGDVVCVLSVIPVKLNILLNYQ